MGARTPEARRRAKYADYMRAAGTPLHITDEEHAQLVAHIMKLYRRGMSCQAILDSVPGGTDIHDSAVSKITRGQVGKCHRDTYNTLMRAVYVQPTECKTGRRIDGTGHRRRLRGLVADGWTLGVIAELTGVSLQAVHQQCVSERDVHASTVANFLPWYEKLSCADPADYGVTKMGIARAKGNARRREWAPSLCWDDDTIDDPDAFPEWTGACGTVTGYNLHRSERVHVKVTADRSTGRERLTVLCAPCCEARVAAKGEQAGRLAARRETIVSMLGEGKSDQFIANEVGLSTRTIMRVRKELAA